MSRRPSIRLSLVCAALCGLSALTPRALFAQSDVVIYAGDVATTQGNWTKTSSSSAAGGQKLASSDRGWSKTDAALASPADYFETSFSASADTTYRVWLRLRASGDTKWNDSVWVQFSDSTTTSGASKYRIGTSDGLLVNLEPCSNCGVGGWGWQDGAYWASQSAQIRFANSGSHTIRVQTREDGVEIDQIVLSPSTYLSNAPGQNRNDSTIVAKSGGSPAPASGSSTPYTGSPAAIPGTIALQNFDNGGQGVAYSDTSSGNSGGAFRSENVDLESSSDGGYNLGWVAAGEWLNYTVDVSAAGSYTATFRVASPGQGGTFHLEMNGTNVTGSLTVPNTGGWQNWVNVTKTVTLSAGRQTARLVMDSASNGSVGNFVKMTFASGGSSAPPSVGSTPTPFSGSPVSIPGTIQAEGFDNGGQGVAYYDSSSGNSGGAYRSTDVDVENSSGVGHNVGWMAPGEWLKYTVNVASSGTYTMSFRVAASGTGGTFHLEMNGTNVTGALNIPNTGGWQNWVNVTKTVTLNAGQQVARLVVDGASNGTVGNFESFAVTSGASAPPPPPPPSSSGTLRIMTWNIAHGRKKDGGYDPYAQAQFIASHNPDVVALQEVQTWDENQPERYRSLLQQFTGQTWRVVWAPVVNAAATEGNVILTRLQVVSTATYQMHATGNWSEMYANRSAAQATVRVAGVDVNVFSTHLDYYNTSYRTTQLNQMMSWAGNFGGPRLVAGDFNSWWGEYWINQMKTQYSDTWADHTGSVEYGFTINNSVRFDYIFRAFTGASRATPTNCYVPATSLSDHYPVVADFRIQ